MNKQQQKTQLALWKVKPDYFQHTLLIVFILKNTYKSYIC